jgi:hypothetical protein
MDKLSVGERFMLMFGRGEYDAKAQRVIPMGPQNKSSNQNNGY